MGVPWACSKCGVDVEPNFEICWNCQAARDPTAQAPLSERASKDDPERALRSILREERGDSRAVVISLIATSAAVVAGAVAGVDVGVGQRR